MKSNDTSPTEAPSHRDKFGRIEAVGIDFIPEKDRSSRPANMFTVFFGGNFAFSVIIFGWLPITFGLNFWQAALSSLTGLIIGTILMAPMALMGPRTGTNNTVSSAAHFGTRGRLIGSALTLLFGLAYAAIAVWTSGDAIVASAHRLIGSPISDPALAIGYAIIAIEIVVVALLGHGTVVAMQKFVAPLVGVLMLLGLFAFAPTFSATATQFNYALGDFWPTWLLAVVISIGGPLSYAPSLGDYSRRISQSRYSDRSVLLSASFGVFLGLFVTALFGAFTSASIAKLGSSYVEDLTTSAPLWYVIPILVIALAGGLGQGVLNLYASGLDLEALIPKLKRIHTTLITSTLAVVLLYVGVFVFNAADSITAMTLVLNGLAGPWVAINVLGFLFIRRGTYKPQELRLLGRRDGPHGAYWFSAGWNPRAVIPWTIGSIFGLLSVSTSLYTGPLAGIGGGVDVSFLGATVIGGVGYVVAEWIWPEPSRVNSMSTVGVGDEADVDDSATTDVTEAPDAAIERVTVDS